MFVYMTTCGFLDRGAVRDLLHPVASVSGSGQHEEGLLSIPLLQSLQREPTGTQPQPPTQPGGSVWSHTIDRSNFIYPGDFMGSHTH